MNVEIADFYLIERQLSKKEPVVVLICLVTVLFLFKVIGDKVFGVVLKVL